MGVGLFWRATGHERLNTTCWWQVVCRRLDGGDTFVYQVLVPLSPALGWGEGDRLSERRSKGKVYEVHWKSWMLSQNEKQDIWRRWWNRLFGTAAFWPVGWKRSRCSKLFFVKMNENCIWLNRNENRVTHWRFMQRKAGWNRKMDALILYFQRKQICCMYT